MQDRTLTHDRITVHFHRSVRDATGQDKGLEGLELENTETGGPHRPMIPGNTSQACLLAGQPSQDP